MLERVKPVSRINEERSQRDLTQIRLIFLLHVIAVEDIPLFLFNLSILLSNHPFFALSSPFPFPFPLHSLPPFFVLNFALSPSLLSFFFPPCPFLIPPSLFPPSLFPSFPPPLLSVLPLRHHFFQRDVIVHHQCSTIAIRSSKREIYETQSGTSCQTSKMRIFLCFSVGNKIKLD